MNQPIMTNLERQIRHFIYRFVVDRDRCPALDEIADEAGRTQLETQAILERLETEHSAIVLAPGSGNLWLADPFAALPTPYPVFSRDHRWYGMCAWDALGILAAANVDGYAPATCPVSGAKLRLEVEVGELSRAEGIVHFAVPAAAWWENIGFT